MFSNVRVNQQIFILDKPNGIFEIGNVCDEPKMRYAQTPPQQQFNNPYYQQPMTVQVVDFKIQTPSGVQTLKGFPPDKNFFENESKTFFATEDKDVMLNELKTLKVQSENHVKQTQYHKDMIGKYDNWIEMLSPEEAEKKQMAKRIDSLEKMNSDLIQQMQVLIGKLDGEKMSKTSKNRNNEKNEDN